jgi:hypothetical protein
MKILDGILVRMPRQLSARPACYIWLLTETEYATSGIFTMAGSINKRNLITIVSVAILVGTEILGAALALAWALGGLLELPTLWQQILIAVFLLGGAYAVYRFFRHAATVEPVFNKT